VKIYVGKGKGWEGEGFGTENKANLDIDGEFHVDLYTLPDSLVKQLWDFTASKVEL